MDGGAVPSGVLDREYEPNRPLVGQRELVSLGVGGAVLRLEVGDEALDLDGKDLDRAQEQHIDGPAVPESLLEDDAIGVGGT